MVLLSLDGVSKTLGDIPLFRQVTLGIDAGEKIGFVGRNGSGKSTFLRILSGELSPDEGNVSRKRDLAIATVEQRPVFPPDASIGDYLLRCGDRAIRPETEEGSAVIHAFRSYCRELGLPDTAVPMASLSGGMLRKVSLARCLAQRADFLTLDEPTNHLDIETILWLEALLSSAPFGFVLVTHDRYFLDAVCTSILEIDGRRIYKYPGNYSSYIERKADRAEFEERAERRRLSILRNELAWLRRGPKARTGKDKSRKDRIRELLDSGMRRESALGEFSSSGRRLGAKVLELHGISKSYDGRTVIRPFSHVFQKGERIGVVGPNGSGKTTFLRIVSGEIEPDTGTMDRGVHTAFAHLDQSGSGTDASLTVLGYMQEWADRIRTADGASLLAEQFLERFLFPRDMQSLALERLSGGEFRRLQLARLLATAPNFLLFDEPTNDFDLDTIRILEEYLADFPGCLLLVSHDRALLDRMTDLLFVFDGRGGIRSFVGDTADYRDLIEEEKTAAARPAGKPERRAPERTPKKAALSYKERREYEDLLAEIEALETEQKDLEAVFQQATPDPAGMERSHRRYREVQGEIEARMTRWGELAGRA
jgi:ABC transport system ATP-binding/permease protein